MYLLHFIALPLISAKPVGDFSYNFISRIFNGLIGYVDQSKSTFLTDPLCVVQFVSYFASVYVIRFFLDTHPGQPVAALSNQKYNGYIKAKYTFWIDFEE